MTFWQSELGELSGKAEDAFTRVFSVIPDNTKALAKIEHFTIRDNTYTIDWQLTDGEFKGQHVFQKLKVLDMEPKKRHKALNMLKYLYDLFAIKPKHTNAPTEDDLRIFVGKHAGIKIQEWSMPKTDGPGIIEGNFVSEVHPAAGFVCEKGVKAEVVHQSTQTAFDRNPRGGNGLDNLDDDIPF
jgi:hypothetical protein